MPKGIYKHPEQCGFQKGHKGFVGPGENHFNFKDKKAGYVAHHLWLTNKYGKPKKCQECGAKGKYLSYQRKNNIIYRWTIEWARKDKKYDSRKLEDWLQLCHKCHFIFDKVGTKAWITRRKNHERKRRNRTISKRN